MNIYAKDLKTIYQAINEEQALKRLLALFKTFYLITDIVNEKWTTPIMDWGLIYSDIIAIYQIYRLKKFKKIITFISF